MRRSVLAVAAVAALLTAVPATAASRRPVPTQARISDGVGDWVPGSQDIVAAQLTTTRAGNVATVRAVITLAEAPDGVAQYALTFGSGCDGWTLMARNLGGGDMQDIRLQHTVCSTAAEFATKQPENAPAEVSVSGKQVVMTAKYALGLTKGMRVDSIAASASPFFTGAFVGNGLGEDGFVTSGDLAIGHVLMALA